MRWAEGEHVLQLYPDAAAGSATGATFVVEGLRQADAVVVIGSTARWQPFLDQLAAAGVDGHAAVAAGRLRLFGAQTVLAAAHPKETLRAILRFARARGGGLRVVSELTDLLWRRGDHGGAIDLERQWNTLARTESFSLLCACGVDALDGRTYGGALQGLGAEHTHLVPMDDASTFDDAVGCALAEVLEPRLIRMVHALSAAHRPAIHLPSGVALLFWLKQHMPRTADKVLERSRARWTAQ